MAFKTLKLIYMEFTKQEHEALKWLLIKGMEITNSDKKYEIFESIHERLVKNCSMPADVGQSEQLVCDCLMPSIIGTPTNNKCIGCGKLFEAN